MTYIGLIQLNNAGKFNQLIKDNKDVFFEYFKCDIYPGSINIFLEDNLGLWQELDKGIPTPDIIIPKEKLINMPVYLGNGQAWKCKLISEKWKEIDNCWVFRRINSKVQRGVLEIISPLELNKPYNLQQDEEVTLIF